MGYYEVEIENELEKTIKFPAPLRECRKEEEK